MTFYGLLKRLTLFVLVLIIIGNTSAFALFSNSNSFQLELNPVNSENPTTSNSFRMVSEIRDIQSISQSNTFQIDHVSGSTSAVCGNNTQEGVEQCDGNDLNGSTCIAQGFDGGALACNACNFDTSGCFNNPAPAPNPPDGGESLPIWGYGQVSVIDTVNKPTEVPPQKNTSEDKPTDPDKSDDNQGIDIKNPESNDLEGQYKAPIIYNSTEFITEEYIAGICESSHEFEVIKQTTEDGEKVVYIIVKDTNKWILILSLVLWFTNILFILYYLYCKIRKKCKLKKNSQNITTLSKIQKSNTKKKIQKQTVKNKKNKK